MSNKSRETALSGIKAGSAGAVQAGLISAGAVAAAHQFWPKFKHIGPSDRAAFVVMPMMFTFWLRCEQHVVGKATGRRPDG